VWRGDFSRPMLKPCTTIDASFKFILLSGRHTLTQWATKVHTCQANPPIILLTEESLEGCLVFMQYLSAFVRS